MTAPSELKSHLLPILRERRDELASQLIEQMHATPAAPGAVTISDDDVRQMIYGFVSMIVEALETDSSETRTFYLETVIPGLKAAGTPLALFVGGSTAFLVRFACALAGALAPEHRAAGVEWIAQFFGDYLGDVTKAWL